LTTATSIPNLRNRSSERFLDTSLSQKRSLDLPQIYVTSAPHAVAPTMKEGPMQYYIPKMLPEYVEVEPDVFQPYSDATVAGWRNEQRLATQQGKHQRAGVTQMVLFADKLQIAESVPLYPYLVRLGDLEKFFLLDR
jgi:hypothetical protein